MPTAKEKISEFQALIPVLDGKATAAFTVGGVLIALHDNANNYLSAFALLSLAFSICFAVVALIPRNRKTDGELSWVTVANMTTTDAVKYAVNVSNNKNEAQLLSLAKIISLKVRCLQAALLFILVALLLSVISTISNFSVTFQTPPTKPSPIITFQEKPS